MELGPNWAAVLWRASFRLATEIPIQVHATFRANEHRGTNLGCPDRAVLYQGLLKDVPGDLSDGLLHYRLFRPNAMNFQASRARTAAKNTIPHALNCRAPRPFGTDGSSPACVRSRPRSVELPCAGPRPCVSRHKVRSFQMETSFAAAGATCILELPDRGAPNQSQVAQNWYG